MELCGRQDPRRVNRYMSHVARAVEHLHKDNIAHNDIKLENVFVDRSDRAVLGDLGLALNVKDGSKTALAGLVGGTRDYWSPEILEADTHTRIDPFKVNTFSNITFLGHLAKILFYNQFVKKCIISTCIVNFVFFFAFKKKVEIDLNIILSISIPRDQCDVYAIGVMYWALASGEDPEADTDFLGRLRAAQDLDLSPSQR